MTLFVRNLTTIDSSYLCTQRGLVGETWLVDLELEGQLDSMSMILDFGQIKKKVKTFVDQEVDHRLLVPMSSPHVNLSQADSQRVALCFTAPKHQIYLRSPYQAVTLIDAQTIDNPTLTTYLEQAIRDILPDNIDNVRVSLHHEHVQGAYYHYSHGLKKHDGNCQRIAHGHRSIIEIYLNGERHAGLENQWARRWQDIYLGSLEDRVEISDLAWDAVRTLKDSHEAFRYQAQQGLFELVIAKENCEIIETDTTIELLSCYIFKHLYVQSSRDPSLCVIAYEGLGKGAITTRETAHLE